MACTYQFKTSYYMTIIMVYISFVVFLQSSHWLILKIEKIVMHSLLLKYVPNDLCFKKLYLTKRPISGKKIDNGKLN